MECTKVNCPMQAGTPTDNCGENCPWRTTAKTTDLILRAEAIEAAIDGADDWDGGYNPERERYIREHMANVPAVDAAPVVHAKAIIAYPLNSKTQECMWRCSSHCSACGDFVSVTWNYCPNCGAKMDGETNG